MIDGCPIEQQDVRHDRAHGKAAVGHVQKVAVNGLDLLVKLCEVRAADLQRGINEIDAREHRNADLNRADNGSALIAAEDRVKRYDRNAEKNGLYVINAEQRVEQGAYRLPLNRCEHCADDKQYGNADIAEFFILICINEKIGDGYRAAHIVQPAHGLAEKNICKNNAQNAACAASRRDAEALSIGRTRSSDKRNAAYCCARARQSDDYRRKLGVVIVLSAFFTSAGNVACNDGKNDVYDNNDPQLTAYFHIIFSLSAQKVQYQESASSIS